MPIGFLDRFIDHLELQRVDHYNLRACLFHPCFEVPRIPGRLNSDTYRHPALFPALYSGKKLLVSVLFGRILLKLIPALFHKHSKLRLVKIYTCIDCHTATPFSDKGLFGTLDPFLSKLR